MNIIVIWYAPHERATHPRWRTDFVVENIKLLSPLLGEEDRVTVFSVDGFFTGEVRERTGVDIEVKAVDCIIDSEFPDVAFFGAPRAQAKQKADLVRLHILSLWPDTLYFDTDVRFHATPDLDPDGPPAFAFMRRQAVPHLPVIYNGMHNGGLFHALKDYVAQDINDQTWPWFPGGLHGFSSGVVEFPREAYTHHRHGRGVRDLGYIRVEA